jgi:hypothetical protein
MMPLVARPSIPLGKEEIQAFMRGTGKSAREENEHE